MPFEAGGIDKTHLSTMKRVKNFFLKSGLLMMAMGMSLAFVSCDDEDLNNGDDNGGQNNAEKTAAAIVVEYTVLETADFLEYCDIVLEYNDGSGAKTDTITATEWKKTLTTALPCKFTFNKTVTLKADKDMAAAEKVSYHQNVYHLNYYLIDADGATVSTGEGLSHTGNGTAAGSKIAASVAEGHFNTAKTYEFDAEGKLK